jgi:hypothetical protein
MYEPKKQAEEEKRYAEQPMRGIPVTREEYMQDISILDASAREKSRRFADDMPIDAILDQ